MFRLTKEMVMEAIPGSCGIISAIAKQCGCSWHTVKRYLDDPDNREEMDAFKAEREAMLDLAEHHLMEAVKAGAPWAVRYVLSRLGKTRGYRVKNKEEIKLEMKERAQQLERDRLADLTGVVMNYS